MAIIPPSPPGSQFSAFQWQDWYEKVRRAINEGANVAWTQINNFVGSNLTDLETRNHNDLQTIQGGTAGEAYHLTSAQHTALVGGITNTVALAKLTTLGANGSLTVVNGIITGYTAPT